MRDNGSFLVAKVFWARVGVLDILKPAGVLQAYSQIMYTLCIHQDTAKIPIGWLPLEKKHCLSLHPPPLHSHVFFNGLVNFSFVFIHLQELIVMFLGHQ